MISVSGREEAGGRYALFASGQPIGGIEAPRLLWKPWRVQCGGAEGLLRKKAGFWEPSTRRWVDGWPYEMAGGEIRLAGGRMLRARARLFGGVRLVDPAGLTVGELAFRSRMFHRPDVNGEVPSFLSGHEIVFILAAVLRRHVERQAARASNS